jgi:hypothetical protein
VINKYQKYTCNSGVAAGNVPLTSAASQFIHFEIVTFLNLIILTYFYFAFLFFTFYFLFFNYFKNELNSISKINILI